MNSAYTYKLHLANVCQLVLSMIVLSFMYVFMYVYKCVYILIAYNVLGTLIAYFVLLCLQVLLTTLDYRSFNNNSAYTYKLLIMYINCKL